MDELTTLTDDEIETGGFAVDEITADADGTDGDDSDGTDGDGTDGTDGDGTDSDADAEDPS